MDEGLQVGRMYPQGLLSSLLRASDTTKQHKAVSERSFANEKASLEALY